MTPKQRIEALEAEERKARGEQLTRIRRQLAMLREADREPTPLPVQHRRFQ